MSWNRGHWRYGNDQVLISADIDRLMSNKRVSDNCKINELGNLYDQVKSAVRNLHSLCVTTDNYGCLLTHILQAFTYCMHSYDRACKVHANGVTCAQKFVHSIDWEHNWKLFIACPQRPLCFKKTRTTTTTVFLISNTVVPILYSHSRELDPQSFASLR